MMKAEIEKIIHKHICFNHYGMLGQDDICIDTLVDEY
jgi:hypothetical protein